jgi:hypothetical protein
VKVSEGEWDRLLGESALSEHKVAGTRQLDEGAQLEPLAGLREWSNDAQEAASCWAYERRDSLTRRTPVMEKRRTGC